MSGKKRIQIEAMPESWFDRPQYRPRLTGGKSGSWFLLDPAFRPSDRLPEAPPSEPPPGRARLKRAFEETYAGWALPRPPATERSLQDIGEAGTAIITAGQQPGFLGGPLYTIYKALHAIALARRYRALTGRPSVPVFWVVSEDHDVEEVREARVPGPGGEEVSFRYPFPGDRRPLADYPIDRAAEDVLDAASRHFAPRRHGERARALIELYRGRSLASGFAALLQELLGSTGLLILDPVHLRPLLSLPFQRVIEKPQEVLSAIEEGRREVKERGLEPMVAARLPFFLLRDGQRHHLSPTREGLRVDGGGPELSRGDLLSILEKDPRSFSAGALLRPVLQQMTLPSVLGVGGPAEVGYFAQLGPLAEYFGVSRPKLALRLNATLVEGKLARIAGSLPLERIAGAKCAEDLVVAEEPDSLRQLRELASRSEKMLLQAVDELAPEGESKRLLDRARKISQEILLFGERLNKMHAARSTQEIEGARKLWNFFFPAGVLQERRWNVLHFIAKHGTDWLEDLIEAVEEAPLALAHRLVTFGE